MVQMSPIEQPTVTYLVSKHHDAVVCFTPYCTTNTLSCMTHGIKCQEVILSDLEIVPQVLQSSLTTPNVMLFKINVLSFVKLVCACAHTGTCVHICECTCLCVNVYVCTYMCACVCVCVCVCVCSVVSVCACMLSLIHI